MGWTYLHKDASQTLRDFFSKEFGDGTVYNGKINRLVDIATIHLKECYMAWESEDINTGDKQVSAVVCILDYQPKSDMNFGYKDITEDMGPNYYNCPERILKLLSPTDNQWAKDWRDKCYMNIANMKSKAPLRENMIIEFKNEFSWNKSIGDWKVFKTTKHNKSLYVQGYFGGKTRTSLLTIPNMKKYDYVEIFSDQFVRGKFEGITDKDLLFHIQLSQDYFDDITEGLDEITRKIFMRDKKIDIASSQAEYFLRLIEGKNIEGGYPFIVPPHINFVQLVPLMGAHWRASIPMVNSMGEQMSPDDRIKNINNLFNLAIQHISHIGDILISIEVLNENENSSEVEFDIKYSF